VESEYDDQMKEYGSGDVGETYTDFGSEAGEGNDNPEYMGFGQEDKFAGVSDEQSNAEVTPDADWENNYGDLSDNNEIGQVSPLEADTSFGVSEAGAGFTVGDWKFGVVPKGSTDDSHDNPQNQDRARRKEEDAREAQRRGDASPNEWWKPQPKPSIDPNDPVIKAIEEDRRKAEEEKNQIPIPPPSKPPVGDYPTPPENERNA
jgi:hypothetical protein